MEGSRYVTILILWNMLITSPIDSTQVQIYINSEGLSDIDLPSKLQVSFSLNEQSRTKLDLRLEPHYHLDIPVYTVHKRKNGNYVTQKVDLVETKNVGIYRNVRHQALFQVTRSHELQSNVSIQTGQFHKDGHIYKVVKMNRVKREAVDDVMHAVESYDITPIINPKLDQIDLVLKNKQKAPNIYEVPTKKSETRTHSQRKPHQARPKRSLTVPTYYIDIAAFVDSTAFQKFLQHAGYNKTLTYLQMREYYAFLFSGINMIYQGLGSDKFKLQVSLSRLVVFEKASDFRFIFIPTYSYQTYFNDFSFRTQVISTKVDSEKVFEKFNQYLTMSARDVTSHNDHAMFFVGSDLWVNYLNLIHQDILGLAHKSSLCETNGKSSSLIEENVDYTNLIVAAHELGHSLSAEHDSTNNDCTQKEDYLMTMVWNTDDSSKMKHLWQFSNCSLAYIESFITNLSHTAHGQMCLGRSKNVDGQFPEISHRLLGQEIPPSKQCQLRHGRLSYDCRMTNYSDICTALYCYDPSEFQCKFRPALAGTSCGSGKVCKQGKCVFEPSAPKVNENCMFGDSRMSSYESCNTSITKFNGHCYNSVRHRRCCHSCAAVVRNIPGCEYGDEYSYCHPGSCFNTFYFKKCCYTCRNHRNLTDSTHNSTSVMTTAKSECLYDLSRYCMVSLCSMESIRKLCCYTCKHYTPRTTVSVASCLYGDISKSCWPSDCSHSRLRLLCCDTCRQYNYQTSSVFLNPITTSRISTTTTTTRTTTIPTTTTTGSTTRFRTDINCWYGDISRHCHVRDCSSPIGQRRCCDTCRRRTDLNTSTTSRPTTTTATSTTRSSRSTFDRNCQLQSRRPEICKSLRYCHSHLLECCFTCSYGQQLMSEHLVLAVLLAAALTELNLIS
ncbi:uncharacterized protein LOC106064023 [Biomphalaria glabrata]|uniref:Uncharacterized protein LOC106064023 n=1 Tax=Biomphalaria glabrata TaxID=6526 RepID=A0A9U8E9R6_BIOGL|nr:uncharacterized protein LOC106064023 [Biomphalaria glabrata]